MDVGEPGATLAVKLARKKEAGLVADFHVCVHAAGSWLHKCMLARMRACQLRTACVDVHDGHADEVCHLGQA